MHGSTLYSRKYLPKNLSICAVSIMNSYTQQSERHSIFALPKHHRIMNIVEAERMYDAYISFCTKNGHG